MKAIVIGSTLEGLRKAALLRKEGWEVTILASGTYLMQDVTETWRDYPLSRQEVLRSRLAAAAQELDLPEPPDGILMPAEVKRLALVWMQHAGVQVRYLTRVLGVSLSRGKLCGLIAADTTGLFHQACERVVDALPYAGGAAAAGGQAVVFPAGSKVTLHLELVRAECREELVLDDKTRLLPGPMGSDHVFVEKELRLPQEMHWAQLRRYLTAEADNLMHTLPRGCAALAQAVPGTALPFCPDAEGAILPALVLEGWNSGTGMAAAPEEMLIAGKRMPWKELAGVPQIDWDSLSETKTDVCIAGMGTAGVWAARSACEQGASVLGVELTPYMGGTRTLGGVTGRYYGNRSRLFAHMTDALSRYAKRFQPEGTKASINAVTETLYYHAALQEVDFAPCTLICGAEVKNNRIMRLLAVGENSAYTISAKQFIDATGNGALSALAGCAFDIGDDFCSVTQNYSQWNRCATSAMGTRSIDQDTMDDTLWNEWTRTLENNLLTAREYDLFDSLTVRESRRIRGRGCITFRNAIRETHYADALCEGYSTYDPHGRCLHHWGRLGLLPALGKARYVSIPLRAVTVNEAANLLVAGKSISCDQDAFNYIRMSGDVAALGWIEGKIAAGCARRGDDPFRAPLKELQQEMYALGALTYLPPEKDADTLSPARLASGTLCGNRPAFHEAMMAEYPETEALLLEAVEAADGVMPDLSMRLMLFYGHMDFASVLHEKLRHLVERCGTIVYSDHQNHDGVSRCGMVNDQPDDYWDMNQLLVLLTRAGYEPVKETILSMLCSTIPGGPWLNEASSYARIRLDCQTIPNFDRIFCLAECAAQLPSSAFVSQLERIYREVQDAPIYDAPFYREFLLLKLAQALKNCGGSMDGCLALLQSRYAAIRRNAAPLMQG